MEQTQEQAGLFALLIRAQSQLHGARTLDDILTVLEALELGAFFETDTVDGRLGVSVTLASRSGESHCFIQFGSPALLEAQGIRSYPAAVEWLRLVALAGFFGLPLEDRSGHARPSPEPDPEPDPEPEPEPTTGQLVVAELEEAGLSPADFTAWAQRSKRSTLGGMSPSQLKRCLEWLRHGNGVAVIRASISEPR
jgi:hypothetical protein